MPLGLGFAAGGMSKIADRARDPVSKSVVHRMLERVRFKFACGVPTKQYDRIDDLITSWMIAAGGAGWFPGVALYLDGSEAGEVQYTGREEALPCTMAIGRQ